MEWLNKCSTLDPNKVNESSKLMQETGIHVSLPSKNALLNLLAFFFHCWKITVECKLF